MIGTKIEWATDTISFWWGCTKVSAACEHCYAEALDTRFHGTDRPLVEYQGEVFEGSSWKNHAKHWGPHAPRMLKMDSALRDLAKIQRRAINGFWRCASCGWEGQRLAKELGNDWAECPKCGGEPVRVKERPRVFINSMSDFFEDRRDLDEARLRALDAMRLAPEVDFLLLTKRPEKIRELLSHSTMTRSMSTIALCGPYQTWIQNWLGGNPPRNLWLGATVENQEWADKRIPELLKVPAAVRFISVEPMLGPVDLTSIKHTVSPGYFGDCLQWYHLPHGAPEPWPGIHWVICGGESGPGARPTHPDWTRSLRDQCAAAGVPFHFKQWGDLLPYEEDGKGCLIPASDPENHMLLVEGADAVGHSWKWPKGSSLAHRRMGKKAAGRLLDGVEHNGMPEVLHA